MTTTISEAIGSDPMATAMAFQPAKLLLTAVDLGVIESLAQAPASEQELRERLDLHPRGTRDFLRALVALGVLTESRGRFQNSPTVTALVRGGPAALDGFLRMADRVMYPAWSRLAEALRTGAPQAETYRGRDMFDELYSDQSKQDQLVRMAEDASRPLIPALTERFDWSTQKSVLELGGCRGNVLAGIVRAHRHLDAAVLDLPQLQPAFDAHMADLSMTGAVRFHAADFFTDPLPPADVVMIGHALVDWDDKQRQTLVRRIFPAVRPGGALLIWDPIIVPGVDSYLRNLIRSINLQLMTPTGGGYHIEDCRRWLTDAGFATVEQTSLGHDVTLVTAWKAGGP
ncbi:methyltransferase [Micromonospora sp. LOL_015]|uniref:methyltransferase n=1 Tax=Micromonospora sp. LOL_015 TaxID=3345416 RepID=UPI003A894B5C